MKKMKLLFGIATMLVFMLAPAVSSVGSNENCTWRQDMQEDENGIDRIICPAFAGEGWCTFPCDGMVNGTN